MSSSLLILSRSSPALERVELEEAAISPKRHRIAAFGSSADVVRTCVPLVAGQQTKNRTLPTPDSCDSATFAVGEFRQAVASPLQTSGQ